MSEFNSFDFAKTKFISLIGMKVMDEVVRFASGTFIPIHFVFEGKEKKSKLQKTKIDFNEVDEETGLQLSLDKSQTGTFSYGSMLYYRNQWVRDYNPPIPFITLHINILKGSAKNILSLSRNQIRTEYRPILFENIKKSAIRYLNKKFDTFDYVTKQLASMFLESQKSFVSDRGIENIVFRDNWRQFELVVNNKETDESIKMSIDSLLSADTIEYIRTENEADQLVFEYKDAKYTMAFDYKLRRICYFLLKIASSYFNLQFRKNGYILSKDTDLDLVEDVKDTKEELMYYYLRRDERARGLIPCNKKYKVLEIDRHKLYNHVNIEPYLDYPCMICPYIRKYDIDHVDEAFCLEYDIDKKVINTTYENRVDINVTKKQIEKAYEEFKTEWDSIVEKVNSKAKKESLDSDLFRFRGYSVII